jgi:hypothetical protein
MIRNFEISEDLSRVRGTTTGWGGRQGRPVSAAHGSPVSAATAARRSQQARRGGALSRPVVPAGSVARQAPFVRQHAQVRAQQRRRGDATRGFEPNASAAAAAAAAASDAAAGPLGSFGGTAAEQASLIDELAYSPHFGLGFSMLDEDPNTVHGPSTPWFHWKRWGATAEPAGGSSGGGGGGGGGVPAGGLDGGGSGGGDDSSSGFYPLASQRTGASGGGGRAHSRETWQQRTRLPPTPLGAKLQGAGAAVYCTRHAMGRSNGIQQAHPRDMARASRARTGGGPAAAAAAAAAQSEPQQRPGSPSSPRPFAERPGYDLGGLGLGAVDPAAAAAAAAAAAGSAGVPDDDLGDGVGFATAHGVRWLPGAAPRTTSAHRMRAVQAQRVKVQAAAERRARPVTAQIKYARRVPDESARARSARSPNRPKTR